MNQTVKENVIEKNIDTQAYMQELTERKEMAELAFLEDNIIEAYSHKKLYQNEMAQSLYQREESYWGMSYYRNHNSAYYDRYWRIWNPQNTTTPQKYFFAEYDTPVEECAENYRDIVQEIELLESNILAFTTIELVRLIIDAVSIGTAVKKGSITNIVKYITETVDEVKDIPVEAVTFIAEAYVLADQANSTYDDVLDAIENRDGQ